MNKDKRDIVSGLKGFYLQESGGKKVINLPRATISAAAVFIGFFLPYSFYQAAVKEVDTSEIKKSTKKIAHNNPGKGSDDQETKESDDIGGIKEHRPSTPRRRVVRRRRKKIRPRYRAKQVLSANHKGTGNRFPLGIKLIGKLLTPIDTRVQGQVIKVLLPYGHSSPGGKVSIPANTFLLGNVNYPGKGDKVFLKITKGVLPSGEEISLVAQALSSRDFTAGIKGVVHGNVGGRAAASLGLTMIGSISETLVQKEALGQGFAITPKATIENGLYSGISKVVNHETGRSVRDMGEQKDYVTVEAGEDLIVSLLGRSLNKK